METLVALDHQLFFLINHFPHTTFLNVLAMILSGMGESGIIWLFLSYVLFIQEEERDHWFFAPVIFTGFASWLLSEVITKSLVARVRPTAELGAIIIGNTNGYSFPSTHATFAWGFAVVLASKEPRATYLFYLLAFLISLSRIYLGKHYPMDILIGSILGVSIGFTSLYIESLCAKTWHKKHRR